MALALEEVLRRSRRAQHELSCCGQEQVDAMVREIALAVNENAEMLAEMAVDETHMGDIHAKTVKNKSKSELIYDDLKGQKTVGVLRRDEETGIVEIAEPVGVVAAIVPCTNPSVTAMSNAMFAIKTRNSVVIAPHPRAKRTTVRTVELMIERAKRVGLPADAISVIPEPTRELSDQLMHRADVVLATGGAAMVRAAYSSGKPSFGVGAGNVPAIIHDSADIPKAVSDIIASKTFDNGLICSSEQSVIVSTEICEAVCEELQRQGAYIVSVAEKARLRYTMFNEDGFVAPNVIGQPAAAIAALARVDLPRDHDVRLIVVPTDGVGEAYPFSGEKMSPVLSLYVTKDFGEAIEIAQGLLSYQGRGHTAVIHAKDESAAIEFALRIDASRVLVNQPSALSSGGSRFNSLTPTTTLGCGTWGGNITSDNITARHLLNIKRLAFRLPVARETASVFEVMQ